MIYLIIAAAAWIILKVKGETLSRRKMSEMVRQGIEWGIDDETPTGKWESYNPFIHNEWFGCDGTWTIWKVAILIIGLMTLVVFLAFMLFKLSLLVGIIKTLYEGIRQIGVK